MLASASLGPLYAKLSDILGEFHAVCMIRYMGIKRDTCRPEAHVVWMHSHIFSASLARWSYSAFDPID